MYRYLIAALLLLFSVPCASYTPTPTETFYVCEGGDGTLPETATCATAWDLSDVSGDDTNWSTTDSDDGKIGPNDQVQFLDEGGDHRRSTGTNIQLNMFGSGLPGKPIVFKNYPGDSPVINASTIITPGTSWTLDSGSIYYATMSSNPWVVTFDESYGYRQADKVSCDSEFDWYYDSGASRLYVYSSGGDPDTQYTTPGIEYAAFNRAATIGGYNYIVIEGIEFSHAKLYGLIISGTSHDISIINCSFTRNGFEGIDIWNTSNNILIEDVTTSRNGTHGISIGDTAHNITIRRWESTRDGIIDDLWEDGVDMSYSSPFKAFQPDSETVTPIASYIVIEYCKLSLIGKRDDDYTPTLEADHHGIWFDNVWATNETTGPVARFNYVDSAPGAAYYAEISKNVKFYGNISVDSQYGLYTRAWGTHANENNLFYNNTVWGSTNQGAVSWSGTGNGQNHNNNVFKNNIIDGSTNEEFVAGNGGANDSTNGTGNVYESNNFGTEYTAFTEWGGTDYNTYDAWLTASSQTDNNTETACMNAPATDDFTLAEADGCVTGGASLGSPYTTLLDTESTWPTGVRNMVDTDVVGAYGYNTAFKVIMKDGTTMSLTDGATMSLE